MQCCWLGTAVRCWPFLQPLFLLVLANREVCGYPSTVHGGLTAAIVDETLGGLYTSMLTNGALGASLPGMTARLEVDYKRPVPAGSTLLCTARVGTHRPAAQLHGHVVGPQGGLLKGQ
jgi:acyl-coenzyme A thioesterase PaaI-like protein